MTIREGKWKCTYCDVMNLGRDLKCTACGAVRDQDVVFIYDENAAQVVDEAELARANAGADWLCETCGTSNPNTRNECRQCSAPRGSSQSRPEQMVETPPLPPPPIPPPSSSNAKRFLGGCLGLSAIVLFLFGVVMLYFTHSNEYQLTVTNVQWQRSVEVENLRTVTEQSWSDQVPSGARVISRHSEFYRTEHIQVGTHPVTKTITEKVQVGTKKVKTGTKNLGNGYFKDIYEDKPVYENRSRTQTVQEPTYIDQPVYKDKVTYQVDRWQPSGSQQSQGQDNSPLWPKINEGATTRAGKRTEKYSVTFKNNKTGAIVSYEVPLTEFTQLVPSSAWRITINNFGTIKEIKPLK